MLLMPKKNKKKGFTLIELIVVVAILAILAAIAIPSYMGLQGRAQQGVEIANASELAGAINVHNAMVTTGSGLTKITGTDGHPTASDVTTLGNLAPTFSDSITDKTKIYNRVEITNGVATVDTAITTSNS